MKDYGWNWSKFAGTADDIRWGRTDLANLDEAIAVVPNKGVALQAGGNIGLFAKRLAQEFDWVYTFEPQPKLFTELVKNAPESNIFRYQAAVGCKPDHITLKSTRRDGSAARHLGVTHVVEAPGPVPTIRLDDFQFPRCDLLYLDVEGWEPNAILGARDTIRRCRPVIAVEINKSLDYVGVHPDALRGLILDAGYTLLKKVRSDEIYIPKERL